ncbi:uncharacterized protein [Gossypium hirsutum]|uniref:Retrovirus-related Pol polyprotein from transposon TNT 1-94-like beta-barrel domain-containing protein n=1 Tax=Gossypium hirsutum TaxID=3635 RepID=A0A1U8NJ47_GOSHI|nr:uncharacterized protein LOC107948749 [Gossypium hirsutum]
MMIVKKRKKNLVAITAKKYWHTRETCWKLYKKLTNGRKKSGNGCGSQLEDSRAFQTTNGNYEWHTRETCWKLYKKLTNGRKKSDNGCGSQLGDSRAFQTTNGNYEGQSSLEGSSFTKEQLEHLHKLFPSPQFRMNSSIPSSSNNPSSFFAQSGNKKIKVADRSFSTIAGKCTVKISSFFVLHDVLHVPNLACNLISISKLS